MSSKVDLEPREAMLLLRGLWARQRAERKHPLLREVAEERVKRLERKLLRAAGREDLIALR